MARVVLLLTLFALAGCDAVGGDTAPSWVEAGAVAVFDYEPGPDSLYSRGLRSDEPYRAVPATPRIVQLEVVRAEDWRRTDRFVRWRESADPAYTLTRFAGDVSFPLDDDDIGVNEYGLTVSVATQCTGNGWVGGSSSSLAFVRVPRTTGRLQTYGNCANGPGAAFDATGPETVTVPAGTFQAIRIDRGRVVEFWSWEAGLVRLDVVGHGGALRGRFLRSAPNAASPAGASG